MPDDTDKKSAISATIIPVPPPEEDGGGEQPRAAEVPATAPLATAEKRTEENKTILQEQPAETKPAAPEPIEPKKPAEPEKTIEAEKMIKVEKPAEPKNPDQPEEPVKRKIAAEDGPQSAGFSFWPVVSFFLGLICALLAFWFWRKKGGFSDIFPQGFPVWPVFGILLGLTCAALAICLWLQSRQKNQRGRNRQRKNTRSKAEPLTLDIGKLHQQGARPDQQDCFSVSEPQMLDSKGILAVVADGMGGLENGGRVSQCAVSSMMEGFYRVQGDPQAVMLSLVEQTVSAVNAELGPQGLTRSGSTLVAGLIRDKRFYCVSVGDSRICLLRGGALVQLNRDHVLRKTLELQAINREISWESAFSHPKSQGLTSYLGMGPLKYVDIPSHPLELCAGDRLILMSDGVYNALSEEELRTLLAHGETAQAAADAIGARIAQKHYDQQDNYTAVILRV